MYPRLVQRAKFEEDFMQFIFMLILFMKVKKPLIKVIIAYRALIMFRN